MIIDNKACEWMKLTIVTEPATVATDWEASIDDGLTYVTAQNVDSASAWLVAGPDYAGAEFPDFTTVTASTHVKVRLIEAPETVIRSAPRITTKDL